MDWLPKRVIQETEELAPQLLADLRIGVVDRAIFEFERRNEKYIRRLQPFRSELSTQPGAGMDRPFQFVGRPKPTLAAFE
jgi:hypothetical protein